MNDGDEDPAYAYAYAYACILCEYARENACRIQARHGSDRDEDPRVNGRDYVSVPREHAHENDPLLRSAIPPRASARIPRKRTEPAFPAVS